MLTFNQRTLDMLNDVPTGHQVENYVRIARSDVAYWRADKPIMHLQSNRARYLTTGEPLPGRGKFFIVW